MEPRTTNFQGSSDGSKTPCGADQTSVYDSFRKARLGKSKRSQNVCANMILQKKAKKTTKKTKRKQKRKQRLSHDSKDTSPRFKSIRLRRRRSEKHSTQPRSLRQAFN
jgi:hypothetical protein